MAAVVRVKAKDSNSLPPGEGEKVGEKKVNSVDSQLTSPLLHKVDEKSDSIVINMDKASSQTTIDKHTLKQNVAMTNSLTHLPEDIEEGEVIGIITLEDVFEELLQVTPLFGSLFKISVLNWVLSWDFLLLKLLQGIFC